MSKYINIVIFSFFSVLSVEYNLGLCFYIPISAYFICKSYRNIFIVIPSTLLSLYFFKEYISVNLLYILLVYFVIMCVYVLIFKKKTETSYLYNVLLVFVLNIFSYLYINGFSNLNLVLLVLSFLISPLVLSFFYFCASIKSEKKWFNSFAYIEVVMALICTFSAAIVTFEYINLGLIVSLYFSMYLASNKNVIAFLYSFVSMFALRYLFACIYTEILLITSGLCFVNTIFTSFILLLYFVYNYYLKLMPLNVVVICLGVFVFFEVCRMFLVKKEDDEYLILNMYEVNKNKVNKEIEAFAVFLDNLSKDYCNKDYYRELNDCILAIGRMHCDNCYMKKECYLKNKGKIYYYLKNLILNNEEVVFRCHKFDDMRLSGYNLGTRLQLKNNASKSYTTLFMESMSNILRQYVVDSSTKEEIDYNKIIKMKKTLVDMGYSICYFSLEKSFIDDYLIVIGFIGIDFSIEKNNIEDICNLFVLGKANVSFKESNKNKTYVYLKPANNYQISYGYGSLAQVGNTICGDNYLIKEVNASKLIAIICDGMGKGMSASIESSLTLKLLDELTNSEVSSDTALQILNTFYYVQDYEEKYTTIDYLQVDQRNGEALFYKAGANTTYVFHDNGSVDKIENENLPYGLNEIIDIKRLKLRQNDIIVMSSDGVFENVLNGKDLEEFIMSIRGLDSQKMAYEILNYSRYADVLNKDDMSVIVLKVL